MDRISSLPDDILHHILSFIEKTEEKAKTSVLCKRWQYLWAYQPFVRLGSNRSISLLRDEQPAVDRFLLSLDQCLHSCKAPILQTLDLFLYRPQNLHFCPHAEGWLHFAAQRSVRNLYLGSPVIREAIAPPSILHCCNLVMLRLWNCTITTVPPDFQGFNCLKEIRFGKTSISDATLNLLLAKSPVLETLYINNCSELINLQVSSQSLQTLVVEFCVSLDRASIDSCNLKKIEYTGRSGLNRFLTGSECLDFVKINLDCCGWGSKRQLDWLWDLATITERLWINDLFFQFVVPGYSLPVFWNLRELYCNVKQVTAPMLSGLVSILRHSPSVANLTVNLPQCRSSKFLDCKRRKLRSPHLSLQALNGRSVKEYIDDHEEEVWDPSDQIRNSGNSSLGLKTAAVLSFVATENEMKLVEYLLGRASVLETLTISHHLLCRDNVIQRLFADMPRASPHVQVQICEVKL